MVRIVHLLDTDAGFQTRRAVECLKGDAGQSFTAVQRTIGRGGTWRNAAIALAALRRDAVAGIDICHAWGTRPLGVAALAGPRRIVYSPALFPTRRAIRWLRAAMNYRDIQVVCPTATLHRQMIQHGVDRQRCHLIRPGVDFARVRGRRNPELRYQLGIADADHAILLPGESSWENSHDLSAAAVSILNCLDPRFRILLWGRGQRTAAVKRLALRLAQPEMVVSASDMLRPSVEFEELLPAADLALVTAQRPVSTLEISLCMAAAIPIVAAVWPTASELLEDRHTALMTPPNSPRALARRILDALENEHLRWSIGDMARTEAYEYCSLTRFAGQYRDLYRQFASGGRVEISPPLPGPGSRFHGRA